MIYQKRLIEFGIGVGVEGNLLNWFISYLSCRKQRVIIEGVHSDWCNIKGGVPQARLGGGGGVGTAPRKFG